MEEYNVKWTQTLSDTFKVKAASEEEALETVKSGECGDVDTIIDNRYEIVVDENDEECPCLLISSDGSEIYHKKFRTVEEARNVMWREAADCCKDAADQQTVLSGSTPLKWEYGYIGMESCHLLSIDSGVTIDGDLAWRIAVI